MKLVMRFVLAPAVVLTLLAAPAPAQDKRKDETEYFPLKEGTRWTYKSGDKSFVVRVGKFEKIGDQQAAQLITETGSSSKDKKEKSDEQPKPIANEHVAVKADGVYRVAVEGKEVKPALLFLKLPPKKGAQWEFKSKVGDQDIKGTFVLGEAKGVKVPGGPKDGYDTVTVRCENLKVDDQTVSFTYYFAPKVGMVKQEIDSGGMKMTVELEKFEEGKK